MSKHLRLDHRGSILEGELITEDKEFLKIKLSSGYNANIRKSEINIISETENKKSKPEIREVKQDKSLPHLLILHTGGTIASKVDYETGAVSAQFKPEELLSLYPELTQRAYIETILIGNIFSGDMRFEHWNIILEHIKKHVTSGIKGVIVSHGTDTIQYTAPALQYSLENLNIPIVIVGAQRSSDRPSSDSYTNLLGAITFIIENSKLDEAYRRVCVCMQHNLSVGDIAIMDSINVKKMHSSRRDAFKSINYPLVAKVVDGSIIFERPELLTRKNNGELSFTRYNSELKVGFFKSHPNLFPEEIKALEKYDGVIIEGTGLGHLGVDEIDEYTKRHLDNLRELEKLVKKRRVVMGTQCVSGNIDLDVYTYGRKIKKTGILGHNMNLCTETLFSRMVYCLSCKDFEKTWNSNLEGFELDSKEVDFM